MVETANLQISVRIQADPVGLNILRALKRRRGLRAAMRETERLLNQNFRNGVTPEGSPLPPTARWTREARGADPNRPTLNVTGGMFRSVRGRLGVRGFSVEPRGRYRAIGIRMKEGGPGMMEIDPARIKTAADGHQYMTIEVEPGVFRTKQVTGGQVPVNVTPRDWIGLSRAQQARVIDTYRRESGLAG